MCKSVNVEQTCWVKPLVMACFIATVAVGFGPAWTTNLAAAQGTAADYQRMERFNRLGSELVDRTRLLPNWLTSHESMWYEVDFDENGSEYFWVDLKSGQKTLLFSSAQLVQWATGLVPELANSDSLDGRMAKLLLGDSSQQVFLVMGGHRFVFDRQEQTLALATADDFPSISIEQKVELKTSRASDQRVSLKFQNQLDMSVELIWIDTQGRPRSYGVVESGQSNDISTFRNHVWLVRSQTGLNLALVEAEFDGQEVQLAANTGIEIVVPRSLRRHAEFYRQGNPEPTASAALSNTSGAAGTPGTPPTNAAVQIARSQRRSPNGEWEAIVQEHRLVLRHPATDRNVAIEIPADSENYFNEQFFWSPDSKFLVAMKEQPAQSHEVHLIESAPRDQLQPKLHRTDYLKPGDRIRQIQPWMIDVERGVPITIDRRSFLNPWGLHDFRWATDSSEFSFRFNQRGHQLMRVIGLRPDGSNRTIVNEESDTFIDYTGKFFVDYIDSTGEIIWASQRDGWNHLYLYDRQSGQVKNQITNGPWVVREVQRVDQQQRRIWFTAGGIHPDQDPYHVHYCHVDFEGLDLVVMTGGDGNQEISYSPDQKYLVATYSRVDLPPCSEIREVATGRLVCELERGDWSRLLASGWQIPQRFSAKGRDGATDIYGVIYRPSNLDPQRKYPVIEYIYAGPQGAFVPKSFDTTRWEKSLCELGFIVVQIDGMGTNHRSKAFHDVCWKNLGDGGFPDRILWLQAAAQMEPAMDLTRVGIFGGSAGGQNAAGAVLGFGDHYHVAVADCGCHDNRMDKIWWNEQWMGWPIGEHYAEQSNVTMAKNLRGKLFLIVGELDRNVDPASTMQVVDALVRADKDFDLLV
ncbi:MAG: prolyl oligopeptidase family serine peptidase, partial [Pirellulaceae bacterium]|nr:prolyl oligopeptidase family serine peptidase [Pirellulaceae bacterium]